MNAEFPSKEIETGALNELIASLELPNFTGVSHLSRRQNAAGKWERCDKYLVVKCGPLTEFQLGRLGAIISAYTREGA